MRSIALATALLLTAGAAAAQTPMDQKPADQKPISRQSCFFVNQFESWKAPDPNTIIIKVTSHRYFRLGLSGSCPRLMMIDTHLVMNVRGPDTICSPLDWDLRVNDSGPGAISTPCIVKSMTEMTPDEVSALPPKFRP
jgi:hypothetical protein